MTWLRVLTRGGRSAVFMVVLLALGVGATTAMFSVVNGVLLRPLPLRHPGQLVLVGENIPQQPAASAKFAYFVNPVAYRAWLAGATQGASDGAADFSGLALVQSSSFTLAGGGAAPQLLHGAKVTPNLFDVLGVRPALGRGLLPADEGDNTRPMVITDALWHSAFHADPGVLGKTIGVPGTTARVVGVLPPSFTLQGRAFGPMLEGQPTQYFIAALDRQHIATQSDPFSDFNYSVLGRLRPGITPAAARAQLDVLQANLARAAHNGLSLASLVTPLQDYIVATSRQELWLLLAGVGAVLLIVCVNLGGLWITRISDRRRDWAIRAALGAAPGRLARQVLGECLALGLVGGGLGILAAAFGLHALLAAAPSDIPRLGQVSMDGRVVAVGIALSVLAGLLTGFIPALRLARSDPHAHLKAAAGSVTADRASLRSRQSLIALQAALSTLLLGAAALIGLSFYRLVSQPVGFATDQAYAASITLNVYNDAQRDHIIGALPAAAQALPGVASAAVTSFLPMQGETWVDGIGVPGRVVPAAQQASANVRFIGPGYFSTLGIPLLAGRDLRAGDRPAGWPPKSEAEEIAQPGAVVISRAAAQLLWPGAPLSDVVGRKILFNGRVAPTVIGVAADARTSLTAAPPAVVYELYAEQIPYRVSLVVRASMPAGSIAASLRRAVATLAPDAPVPTVEPLTALKAAAVAPQRYQLTLLLLFAGLALLLAAIGVYALIAHSVARRAKELAIRISLGAPGPRLWRDVVRQALAPVAVGVAAGTAVAVFAGQVLSAMLFEVQPANPAALAAAAATVLIAAFAACLAPARRATRTDPLLALRAE